MWSDGYLAIPFLAGGRTRAGCDCYGLVRLVLMDVFGKEIPSYAEAYGSLSTAEIEPVAAAIRSGVPADAIDRPKAGDVAVIALRGHELHCGVFVDDVHVLHTDRHTGPVVDDVNRPRLFGKVKAVYRVH